MVMDIVLFLVIGLVACWLASLITKREGKGIVSYLIIGVIGALLGGCLFRLLHLARRRSSGTDLRAAFDSSLALSR